MDTLENHELTKQDILQACRNDKENEKMNNENISRNASAEAPR